MVNPWLSVLNDDTDRLICQTQDYYLSMSHLRGWIIELQAIIAKHQYQNWVLYDSSGFHFLCALFALLLSGKNVLIPPNRSPSTIEGMLNADAGLIGNYSAACETINMHDLWAEKFESINRKENLVACEEMGSIGFFTSGSSGKPKVVFKSAEQLYLEASSFQKIWSPKENSLFIPLVSHLHVYGFTFAFLFPLLSRSSFYLPNSTGLLGALDTIVPSPNHPLSELLIVTSPTVGRQFEQIQRLAKPGSATTTDRPAAVSQVFCAGDKLTDENVQRIIKLFDCPCTEIFGSTETGAVAHRKHTYQVQSAPKLWKLFPNLSAVVHKKSDGSTYSAGEFSVWGGHVGGDKENPVSTSDQVQFHSRHEFELLGRNDSIYKIEGKRVSSADLIETLDSFAMVNHSVVLPHTKNNKDTLFAGVVLSQFGVDEYRQKGKFFVDQSIREYLMKFFDPVLVPRVFRYLDENPRDEMSKLPKSKLIDLLAKPVLPKLPLVNHIVAPSKNELMLSLSIPMELHFFRGHFERSPIVPGVILLHWVFHFIRAHLSLEVNPGVISRLKFFNLVTPGTNLNLVIKKVRNNVEFLYQNEEGKFSSGQILIKENISDV